MATVIPDFIAPGVKTTITARPIARAQTRGTTAIAVAYMSPRGRDNLWVRYENYDQWFEEQGGELNFNRYGQAQYTADTLLKNGAVLLGMTVKPNNARFSHLVVGVQTKRVNPITHPTDPGVPVRARIIQPTDPENLESGLPKRGEEFTETLSDGYTLVKHKIMNTNTATRWSSIENYFETGNGTELDNGFKLNKILMAIPRGRGKDYDRFGIQIGIDRNLDRNFSWRVYTFQFVKRLDDGGVVDIDGEGPWSVAFDPNAKNRNNVSMFIEDVVKENSTQFRVKFNTDAYLAIVDDLNAFKDTPVDPYEYDIITGRDRPVGPGDAALPVPHNNVVFTDEIASSTSSQAPTSRELRNLQRALEGFDETGIEIDTVTDANHTEYEKFSVLTSNAIVSDTTGFNTDTSTPDTNPNQVENDTSTINGKRPQFSPGSVIDKLYRIPVANTKSYPVIADADSISILDPEDNDVDLADTSETIEDVISQRGVIFSTSSAGYEHSIEDETALTVESSLAGQFTIEDGASPVDPELNVNDIVAFPQNGIYYTGIVTDITTNTVSFDSDDVVDFSLINFASDLRIVETGSLPDYVDITSWHFKRRDTVFADSDFVSVDGNGIVPDNTSAPYTESPSLYEQAKAFYKNAASQWDNSTSAGSAAFEAAAYLTAQRGINAVGRLIGNDIPGAIADVSPIHTRSSTLPNFTLGGNTKLDELEGNNYIDYYLDGDDANADSFFFAANIPLKGRAKNLSHISTHSPSLEDLINYIGAAGLDEGLATSARTNLSEARSLFFDYTSTVNSYIDIMSDTVTKSGDLSGEGGFGTHREQFQAFDRDIPDVGDITDDTDKLEVMGTINSVLVYAESVIGDIDSVREMSDTIRTTEAQATKWMGGSTYRGRRTSQAEYDAFTTQVALLRRRVENHYSLSMIVETAKDLLDLRGFSSAGVFDAVILELDQAMHEFQKLTLEKLIGETEDGTNEVGYIRRIFDNIVQLRNEFLPIATNTISTDTFDDFTIVIENRINDIISDAETLESAIDTPDTVDWNLPVFFANGSDGSLDPSKLFTERFETFHTLVSQAYRGIIPNARETLTLEEFLPGAIRNKKETALNLIIDSNYPVEVKSVISELAEQREDIMAWLDTNFVSSVNNAISFRRRQLPVTHWTSAIYTHTGETVDSQTAKLIQVTAVYDLARKIGNHDANNGIGAALAGIDNGQVNLTRINYVPQTQSERDRLYENQINHVSENEFVGHRWRAQLTAQQRNDPLSEIPNVRVVQNMVRVAERMTENYEFIRFADDGRALYQSLENEINGYLRQFEGNEIKSGRALVYGSAADRLQKLTRIAIEVLFFEFQERFLIAFTAGSASQT